MDRQQLSGFADLLSEAAAFVSRSGVIEVANHSLSVRIEQTPAGCVGRHLGELMPEGASLQRMVDQAVESGGPVRSFLPIARGQEIEQLLVIATPCAPCAGRTEPLVLLRLFPQPPSADAVRQAKDEFLSVVSHELRSPINAIVTWAHLLRQGGLDDVVAGRALEAIERNARLQARILDDLREMSGRPAAAGGAASDRAFRDVTPLASADPGGASGKAPGSAPEVVDLDGIRVLVVDDDRDARESITTLLLEHHAEASNAGSVREALRNLAERPPHVVVTDLLMPDLDGFSLLRMIRTIEELNAIRIPTIALTALASEESQRRGLDSGFDVYLMKPVTPDELLSIVAAAAHSQGSSR